MRDWLPTVALQTALLVGITLFLIGDSLYAPVLSVIGVVTVIIATMTLIHTEARKP